MASFSVPSTAPSQVLSCVQSIEPFPVPSHGSSIAQSPVPSSMLSSCDLLGVSEEISQAESRSKLDSNSDQVASGHELDLLGPRGIDGENDDINDFMAAGGSKPKAKHDIHDWHKLQEQIKSDLAMAHKQHEPLSRINQFLILRNFATLQIKGIGCIVASQEVARQWQDGVGVHFARQVHFLARHYQLFEHLPASH